MANADLQRTHYLSISEVFQSTIANKGGFGIDNYRIPTTTHYLSKGNSFSLSKRKDLNYRSMKNVTPGPSEYTSLDNSSKRSCTFDSSAKESIIAEIMRKSAALPGPAEYSPKGRSSKENSVKGKFG